jgi:hypothetical protein
VERIILDRNLDFVKFRIQDQQTLEEAQIKWKLEKGIPNVRLQSIFARKKLASFKHFEHEGTDISYFLQLLLIMPDIELERRFFSEYFPFGSIPQRGH